MGTGPRSGTVHRWWEPGQQPRTTHIGRNEQVLGCAHLNNCAFATLGLPPQVLAEGPDLAGQGTDTRFCVPQRVRPSRTCHIATGAM